MRFLIMPSALDKPALENALCEALCARVRVIEDRDKRLLVSTPFRFPDGDEYQIYIEADGPNAYRITDGAHTLMHMSYEFDIDALNEGRRRNLFESVLAQNDLTLDEGEIYKVVPREEIAEGVLTLGQALTRVFEISTHSREHIASTFYEDLRQEIFDLVDRDRITENYIVPGVPKAKDYPIDYRIETPGRDDFFLFGVPSRDKAQVTTIVLMHMLGHNVRFESLVVLNDQYSDYGSAIFNRMMNYAGELVTIDDRESLSRKITHRVA